MDNRQRHKNKPIITQGFNNLKSLIGFLNKLDFVKKQKSLVTKAARQAKRTNKMHGWSASGCGDQECARRVAQMSRGDILNCPRFT